MKKLLVLTALSVSTLILSSFSLPVHNGPVKAQNVQTEEAMHPRIAKAIHEMQDAIDYMSAAPHDFGGYKARAIQDTRKAIESLRMAMHYRAVQDRRHR